MFYNLKNGCFWNQISKNRKLELCIRKWVVLHYQNPSLGRLWSQKPHTQVRSKSHLVEWKQAREYPAPWLVSNFTSDSLGYSSGHGPFLLVFSQKIKLMDPMEGREKAIAFCNLLVHSKPGLLQVLWQSRENKWNSKISFNLENNPFDPFLSSRYIPHSCHSLHPMEHEFYEDNEYLSSLPADADRAEDFEYEVRSFSHHFTFLCEVMVKGFCTTRKI